VLSFFLWEVFVINVGDRLTEFPDDQFDRHFLIGKPTVSPGISASSARTAKNTTPATTAMWYPDTRGLRYYGELTD
jgi:hypothetical protein